MKQKKIKAAAAGYKRTVYAQWVHDAAGILIGQADNSGCSLVDVIATVEQFIVEQTKVGDALVNDVEPGRRGYTLKCRLAETTVGRRAL